jgi:hypothetical protein
MEFTIVTSIDMAPPEELDEIARLNVRGLTGCRAGNVYVALTNSGESILDLSGPKVSRQDYIALVILRHTETVLNLHEVLLAMIAKVKKSVDTDISYEESLRLFIRQVEAGHVAFGVATAETERRRRVEICVWHQEAGHRRAKKISILQPRDPPQYYGLVVPELW